MFLDQKYKYLRDSMMFVLEFDQNSSLVFTNHEENKTLTLDDFENPNVIMNYFNKS